MNTQEEARKSMAEVRHHEEHIEDNMLQRSQEKIEQSSDQGIEAEARDLMAQHRQDEEHTKETMLSRSEAEIGNS